MNTPWYKQFWPWFLIALPGSVVVASIATIIIAVQDPDGLVNDDYYKQGLLINRTLEKEQQSHNLALRVVLHEDEAGLRMQIYSRDMLLPAQSLTIALAHPTRASRDQQVSAHYDEASNSYLIPVQQNSGEWQLIVEPQTGQWRVSERLHLPLREGVTFSYQ